MTALADLLDSTGNDLATHVARSRDELHALRSRTSDRLHYEQAICDRLRGQEQWTLPGFCQACGLAVELAGDWLFSDGETVNFRERLVCPSCELNNRQRFMAHLVRTVLGPGGDVYLYEQVTPFFLWAERTLGGRMTGSEYLGHDIAPGAVIQGVRHEDALALTFDDASFDMVVSNDVYEHVPDIERALAECVRVLRPEGRLLFSIPFHELNDETHQRAELRDGEVVELLPAQYHGNPISAGGSLVFYDHGWAILDACRNAGFRDAYLVGYWSSLYGYLGGGLQMVFVAER